MDELMAVIKAQLADGASRRHGDLDLAFARQRDGAAQDMRAIGAFIAGNLFAADDPERFAGLNTGVRVPVTLDQPGSKTT